MNCIEKKKKKNLLFMLPEMESWKSWRRVEGENELVYIYRESE
jgi:hypothetical protein